MEDQFNLIGEPWIDVSMQNGSIESYGIQEVLLKAHEFAELHDSSPLMKYGVYRFLIAFVSDAFNIRTTDDIEEMLELGRFDSKVLIPYFEKYFDRFFLFSENKPFYQNPSLKESKKEKNIIEILQFFFPKGNNTILFYHKKQEEHAFSPGICAKILCTLPAFGIAAGRGYKPSINGKPPWYVLVKGKNLFETIVLSCCGMSIEVNAGEGQVPWRLEDLAQRETFHQVSTVQGLTWVPRYILLIPSSAGRCTYSGKEANMLVSKIFFEQGWSFEGNWVDPHVSYIITQKGPFTLQSKSGKKLWRDIGPLMLISDEESKVTFQNPKIISQFQLLKEEDSVSEDYSLTIEAYGLTTNQAKYLEWQEETLSIPLKILKNPQKSKQIQSAIDLANKVEYILKNSISEFSKRDGRKLNSIYESLKNRAISEYWTCLEGVFNGFFLLELENQDEDDINASIHLQKEWKQKLRNIGANVLDSFLGEIDSNPEFLKKQVKARDYYFKNIYSSLFASKNKSKSKNKKGGKTS